MWRLIFLSSSVVIAAMQAPVLFDKVLDARENPKQAAVEKRIKSQRSTFATSAQKPKAVSYSGRKVRLKAGYGGSLCD